MCRAINPHANSTNPVMSILGELFEIIGYPVVEGSTGWALYHAIDGKIVTMDGCVIYKIHDGKLWECFPDDSNEWRVVADDGIRHWLKYIHDKTGWQIYTEPEPAYKVGDWVEVNANGVKKQGKIMRFCEADFLQNNTNALVLHDVLGRWYGYHRVEDIIRKLDPSEVRVKVTLEGQVTKPVDNAGGRFWLYYSTDEYVTIELDALSNKDRELVESILKAQEEK